MAHITADRVLETSTSTGTGALALAGAVAGHQRFSDVCSTSDTVYYAIWAVDGNGNPSGEWEVGLGTYSAANELTRTTPADSSNSGSAVDFSAGTKNVAISLTAGQVDGFGGGGGETVWTETLSAASSIDFEDFAGGGYSVLVVEIDLEFSNNGVALTCQYKLNGGYKTSTDYRFGIWQLSSGGSSNGNESGGAAAIELSGDGGTWGIGNAAVEGLTGVFKIVNPENTSRAKHITGHGAHGVPSGQLATIYGGGYYEGTDNASALEGLRFAPNAGTMTGTIRIRARA